MRGPDLGRIGTDDGKAAIGEEEGHRQDQPERRHAKQRGVVIVACDDGEDTSAEAKQAAGLAPSHQFGEVRERQPPDKAAHGKQDHHLGGFLRRDLQQQHEQRRRP